MSRSRLFPALVVGAAVLMFGAGLAAAQTSFNLIGEFYVIGLSDDGNVAGGAAADGTFGAVRWTAESGPVPLGLSSGEILGTGGGYTCISADGNRLCSTIANVDSTASTQGLWTKGQGWQRLLPPFPAGAGQLDTDEGTTWGLSGDGNTVVGLIWVNGHGHASAWTAATNAVDLGAQAPTASSRANTANYDGSVIGGWSASPITGAWQPTVWENGILTVLNPSDVRSEVQCVNADGTVLGGMLHNAAINIREPALWFKTGETWTTQPLGYLPGSGPFDTSCISAGISADGTILVGQYLFDNWNRIGFVWTFDAGLMTASDYLASVNVTIPAGFSITGLSAITPDGSRIAGYGYDEADPAHVQSFIVTLWQPSPVPAVTAALGVRLAPAYPNPFNPTTSLSVAVDRNQSVHLEIFDARGALVRSLYNGELAAGQHVFQWDGRSGQGRPAPAGVYLARARGANGAGQNQRLALVK